ncbi:hypothetical protein M011DRAFT_515820 [Sporormia fimetaria CBS 119925]|uniref:Uncharacterized protein n=1 Tax=Sporormia fimetaria CBS 119925 TaxID=1340428 RepID=A0A6A6VCV2_9PLEO|nr:hypothetical protein M011DRAFT_515820 [Sporormia fimetaria CBS 119925]
MRASYNSTSCLNSSGALCFGLQNTSPHLQALTELVFGEHATSQHTPAFKHRVQQTQYKLSPSTPLLEMHLRRFISPIVVWVSELANNIHPMEYGSAPIATEKLPDLQNPWDQTDPLYGHCCLHCRHNVCQHIARDMFERDEYVMCTCNQSHPIPPLVEQHNTRPSTLTLNSRVKPFEQEALANLDPNADISISKIAADAFLAELSDSDCVGYLQMARLKGFRKIHPGYRGWVAKLAIEGFFDELRNHFHRTFRPPTNANVTFFGTRSSSTTNVRSVSPRALKLELIGVLWQRMMELDDTLPLGADCVPSVPYQNWKEEKGLLQEIWFVWESAVDQLLRLFILEHMRRTGSKRKRPVDLDLSNTLSSFNKRRKLNPRLAKRRNITAV